MAPSVRLKRASDVIQLFIVEFNLLIIMNILVGLNLFILKELEDLKENSCSGIAADPTRDDCKSFIIRLFIIVAR
jgi:hypothetical protein